eukprot:3873159-Amphidinium_carterae.1
MAIAVLVKYRWHLLEDSSGMLRFGLAILPSPSRRHAALICGMFRDYRRGSVMGKRTVWRPPPFPHNKEAYSWFHRVASWLNPWSSKSAWPLGALSWLVQRKSERRFALATWSSSRVIIVRTPPYLTQSATR